MWLPLVMRQTAAVAKVTPEMLRSVWQETDYRWDVCRITNGSHIEPLLSRGKTRCVLLHFDSSKRCVCPLYKFLYAFKVVKLFLKHPVYCVAVPEIEFLHKNVTCNTKAECGTVRPQNCDTGFRCGGTLWSRKYVTWLYAVMLSVSSALSLFQTFVHVSRKWVYTVLLKIMVHTKARG